VDTTNIYAETDLEMKAKGFSRFVKYLRHQTNGSVGENINR